jgi:hypothetical protein
MTPGEIALNNSALDYRDFANSYFAPRRALAAIDFENLFFDGRIPVWLSFLAQFDLHSNEKLNSQYLAGKMTMPLGAFGLNLGGCLELIEVSKSVNPAFAADIGFAWKTGSQGLSVLGRYSSGQSGAVAAFQPFNTISQGYVLKPKLSSLSMLSLDYTAQLHPTFSFSLLPSYFVLGEPKNGGRFLGAEFYGALYWSPAPNIFLNLGSGVFLHSLGNTAPDKKNPWCVDINLIISLR